jgi:hypothetical protein
MYSPIVENIVVANRRGQPRVGDHPAADRVRRDPRDLVRRLLEAVHPHPLARIDHLHREVAPHRVDHVHAGVAQQEGGDRDGSDVVSASARKNGIEVSWQPPRS